VLHERVPDHVYVPAAAAPAAAAGPGRAARRGVLRRRQDVPEAGVPVPPAAAAAVAVVAVAAGAAVGYLDHRRWRPLRRRALLGRAPVPQLEVAGGQAVGERRARPAALLRRRRRRQRKLLRLRRDGGWRRRHSRSGGGGGGGRVKRRGRLELAGEVDQDSARWNGGVVQTAEEGVGAWEEVRRRRRISQDPFCTGVVYSALQKTPLNGTGWPACHAAWGCLEGGVESRVNF
jgi:hypothetical protein